MELLLALCLGVGISAACGYRVFIPFLIISFASRAGQITLSSQFSWISSDIALITLLIASIIEILAFYIPWLDNILDTISFPVSIIAGTVLTASFITGISPYLAWVLALIIGGTTAGTIKGISATARLVSTGTTGGMANHALATMENISSLVLSFLSLFLPILTAIVIVIAIIVLLKKTFVFFLTKLKLIK